MYINLSRKHLNESLSPFHVSEIFNFSLHGLCYLGPKGESPIGPKGALGPSYQENKDRYVAD